MYINSQIHGVKTESVTPCLSLYSLWNHKRKRSLVSSYDLLYFIWEYLTYTQLWFHTSLTVHKPPPFIKHFIGKILKPKTWINSTIYTQFYRGELSRGPNFPVSPNLRTGPRPFSSRTALPLFTLETPPDWWVENHKYKGFYIFDIQ